MHKLGLFRCSMPAIGADEVEAIRIKFILTELIHDLRDSSKHQYSLIYLTTSSSEYPVLNPSNNNEVLSIIIFAWPNSLFFDEVTCPPILFSKSLHSVTNA